MRPFAPPNGLATRATFPDVWPVIGPQIRRRGTPHRLAPVMLAGLPVPDHAVDGLAELVRAAGADDLADRLEQGPE